MSWILEYFVVYLCVHIYVRLVMSSYLLFCCIYFDAWCITCCPKREETLEVYRVVAYICYIYLDAWCITCCWGMSARSAGGGVRFHREVDSTVVVFACVIFIHGFSQCRGHWTWVFCCLFVVRKYMFGWLCQATCSFVPTSMLGISHAVQNEKLWKFT